MEDKMNYSHLTITDVDRRRLGALLSSPEGRAWGTRDAACELETILEDASCVNAAEAPETLVTMNTEVELEDLDSGARRRLTVAYPQDADAIAGAASVVEPAGVSLIGCQVGDVVQFADEPEHDFRIAALLYQPEQAGAHYL
jgi:regulator of nucleoside diphosphate kinase